MTPPSRVHASASAQPASDRASRVATAKKPAARKAAGRAKRGAADADALGVVEDQRKGNGPAEDEGVAEVADTEVEPEAPDLEALGDEAADIDIETEVVLDVETDEVVVTVGKKRSLDDVDESTFEPAEEAKLEGELTEDEGFTLSEADDADEPEQQVMAAGATALGAAKARIEIQTSFVSSLMDAIEGGISQLVDADMNEESTRLQALQVKQQLGIQALSIANGSSQSILRLFQ